MAAAAPAVPDALLEQLAPAGRMVLPVGTREQHLVLIERSPQGFTQTALDPVRFVPLLPGAAR
jgi:protein-L-isoaspartate(D-aspartate) O-methyltransferase